MCVCAFNMNVFDDSAWNFLSFEPKTFHKTIFCLNLGRDSYIEIVMVRVIWNLGSGWYPESTREMGWVNLRARISPLFLQHFCHIWRFFWSSAVPLVCYNSKIIKYGKNIFFLKILPQVALNPILPLGTSKTRNPNFGTRNHHYM